MRRSRRQNSPTAAASPSEVLCRRAWRSIRRGESRRAMLSLREAAYGDEDDARLWTLYGAHCLRMGYLEAARHALTHAAWLRERRQEPRKAKIVRELLAAVAI
jgi:Flp pilus assembly protein TadD